MRLIRVECGSVTDPTVETVDQLACLELAARRNGGRLELMDAPPCLLELLDLCGLAEVLEAGPLVEMKRQAEQGKDARGVQEEGELPDPAA